MEHARYKSSMVVNTECPRNMYMSQAPRPYNLFHVHRSHMALSVRISNSCQQLEDREQEPTGPPPPAVSATPNSNLFAKRRCIKITKITAVSGTLSFNHIAKFLRKIRNLPFSTQKLLAPKPISMKIQDVLCTILQKKDHLLSLQPRVPFFSQKDDTGSPKCTLLTKLLASNKPIQVSCIPSRTISQH